MENKIILEATLVTYNKILNNKEIAAALQLPTNDQKDLMFMSAILVSTGVNANGACFLGSELIKAKDTVAQKPLNIEHDDKKIIGHISNKIFMDYNGNLVNEEDLYSKIISEVAEEKFSTIQQVDKMDLDIGIVAIVYKDIFKDIAEEVANGEWKVSMECYYEDFDLKVGNLIIPKDQIDLYKDTISDLLLLSDIKAVVAGQRTSSRTVSRVLRNIRFCGCGIVKNPAEKRAVILEAANYNNKTASRESTVGQLKEAAQDLNNETQTWIKSPLSEDSIDNEIVQYRTGGFMIMKNRSILSESLSHNYNKIQREVVELSAISKIKGSSDIYEIVELDSSFVPRNKIELNETSEAVIYRTTDNARVKEIILVGEDKEKSTSLIRKWGPEDDTAGICINFRKYRYEMPGRPNPGKILSTHWCQQFQKPCPVFGADAQDPACLIHTLGKSYTANINKATKNATEEKIIIKAEEQTNQSAQEVTIKEPATDLFSILRSMNVKDRINLTKDEFGIRESREFPIHNKELVIASIQDFDKISKKLNNNDKVEEFYKNLLIKAIKLDIAKDKISSFIQTVNSNDFYGIPRLKLLPLTSKEQVMAAMSRFFNIKVDISSIEREQLVVNILRAAKTFDIDVTKFINKVRENL